MEWPISFLNGVFSTDAISVKRSPPRDRTGFQLNFRQLDIGLSQTLPCKQSYNILTMLSVERRELAFSVPVKSKTDHFLVKEQL